MIAADLRRFIPHVSRDAAGCPDVRYLAGHYHGPVHAEHDGPGAPVLVGACLHFPWEAGSWHVLSEIGE